MCIYDGRGGPEPISSTGGEKEQKKRSKEQNLREGFSTATTNQPFFEPEAPASLLSGRAVNFFRVY